MRDPIPQENVSRAVRVVRDEVGRLGVEDDVAAVCRHRGGVALGVGFRAVRRDADSHRLPFLAVANEDVSLVLGVAGDEILRVGGEGDEAPVFRDRRVEAARLALALGGTDADSHRLSAHAVSNEDVARAVRVVADQVRGERLERDVASI